MAHLDPSVEHKANIQGADHRTIKRSEDRMKPRHVDAHLDFFSPANVASDGNFLSFGSWRP
jgi:hypothetical protein